MISLVKDNYIQSYGNGSNFKIEIDKLPTNFNNYFKESCKSAEEIYSLKQGNLNLLYSGGVDSEYTLNVFLHLNIPITPVIVKLNSEYNSHDLKYALDFCESKNLKPIIIDIDYEKFVNNGTMFDLSMTMKSSVPHYSTIAYGVSKLDGTILLGDGEPYISLNQETMTWDIVIYEYDYAMINYFKNNNIYGTPHFNRYSPEMMIGYLSTTRMKELANNKHFGKLGSNSSKWIMYNEFSNFNLVERPKFHGMELIEKCNIFNHESFSELKKIGQQWDGIYRKNYFEFIKEMA